MAITQEFEDYNTGSCTMAEFYDDLEAKLALLTGLVDYSEVGLTLTDVRKPMFVSADPGVGKTMGVISVIKAMNDRLKNSGKGDIQLGFKKILLGQTVVGSLSGIPVAVDGDIKRAAAPELPVAEKDGEYGVLFLDEITTADEMQIQPALGLADDSRSIGLYKLPEHWLVVAAGNGPNCTNFKRMDDMTLSRFITYNISYNYKTDWRPWAHKNNINPDIIAFLNFSPDACSRVESTDTDEAGKMAPSPRTWEALDKYIKTRKAMGKPITDSNMTAFASRVIGVKAAREFGAFLAFKTKVKYDPAKILDGTEDAPSIMQKEEFHILLQGCIKAMLQEMHNPENIQKQSGDDITYTMDVYQKFANMLNWFLEMKDLENTINAITELRDDIPEASAIMLDPDFDTLCPKFNEFLLEHDELILNNLADIESIM